MTGKYFDKFPLISYANNITVNITERAVLINKLYSNPNLFYPYDVVNGERPDTIANRYYDDSYMSWMLYFTNKIIDPYYEWYMSQDVFNSYIVKKYSSYALASSKTKYYRNNWYSQTDSISVTAFNALTSDLFKFYKPNYGSNVYGAVPLNYVRKQEDWTIATNQIVNFQVANSSPFSRDEIVNVSFNGINTGAGQVCFSNASSVSLQHIQGTVTGAIIGSCFLYGTESTTNSVFISATSLSNTIPITQITYWSPVTYYDYENELNEKNKSILVLNSRYSSQLASQLKDIM
jgi:hypothetical protein